MPESADPVSLDVSALIGLLRAGAFTIRDLVRCVQSRLERSAQEIWIYRVTTHELEGQARALERRCVAGEVMPLYGVPFAVKDNIDVAGLPTTAGCPAFASVPQRGAVVVDNLVRAGAILVGKTNMDQFASGLAGDRSPYGACRNPFDQEYIGGGSSSGSALAVATGVVSFALGTDTAGSGRVPAGCENIIGLKPTAGTLSTEGVVPACPSLDCVSVFALTAQDAWRVCTVAAGGCDRATLAASSVEEPLGPGWVFAVPREEDREFFGDRDQAEAFRDALGRLEAMGGRALPVDFQPLREVAQLLYEGPWLAERLSVVERFLREHAADVHPVTRAVLQGGARFGAGDVFRGQARLEVLRARCARIFEEADILVVPTMPTIPKLADVQADSPTWSRRLGHYTNFVNLLRWAAIALPAGFTSRGLPASITAIGPSGSDRQLCRLGMAWQRRLALPLGATRAMLPDPDVLEDNTHAPVAKGFVRVAVAGAHLRGQPLHGDMRRFGARWVRACRTAARFRFVALMHLDPPRPGLLRDDNRAGAVAVEIYDLPHEGFGRLVASVAPPLAIGTVELADGEAVKGFLCESFAAARAADITDFGGWAAFRNRQASAVGGSA